MKASADSSGSEGRPGLRGLAFLGGCLALSVGSPVLLVAVPLAACGLLLPGVPPRGVILGMVLMAVALLGGGGGGLADVDRGWTLLLAGGFVAATLAGPRRPFIERALVALGVAMVWAVGILSLSGGWNALDLMVGERIAAGTAATLQLGSSWIGSEGGGSFGEAARRTAEAQHFLFPAQAGLAALLGLGGAWWLHQRVSGTSDAAAIGSLRGFRFPDAMIWIFIAGVGIVLAAGWTEGWGRFGANLMVFVGALLALRGAAVLLVLTGGVTWFRGLLVLVGLIVAAPVLLAGALVVGLGDVWLDLRTRALRDAGSAPE
ncbi:MAG: DUF2232 domain-containing protein [Gemmatimonadales bacterium]|nr:MAG: DUF2232 domain-containing protein [Gemmatimonadales bacterium]